MNNNKGQALTEYLLMLSAVVMIYLGIAAGLVKLKAATRIMKPFREDFAKAYQYGHTKAKGYDDGGPENHPLVNDPSNNNFRIFLEGKGNDGSAE